MTEGAQWAGQPISSRPNSSSRSGWFSRWRWRAAALEDVVHAQVYLTDRDDYSAFNEAWTRHFVKSPPTLDIIPCIEHGLAPYDGNIEINVLRSSPARLRSGVQTDAGVPTAFRHQPQAMKAGDLLFMSGLMAFDGHGLAASAAIDSRQPQFSSSAEAQAEFIIGNIAKLCEAAGTSLSNVVRILQFHTDIREFYPVYKVWERRLGGRPVAVLGGRGPPHRSRCRGRPC